MAFLLLGGFNDGYRDSVFRMAKTFPVFRGIIGPWSHDWPDCNRPGNHDFTDVPLPYSLQNDCTGNI